MANIITSKTRLKITSQPRERMKMLGDLREKTREKHGVYTVKPTIGLTEEDIHKEINDSGHGIQEAMEATRENNQKIAKQKQKIRKERAAPIVRERLKATEERDRRNGTLDKVRANLSKLKKR